MNIDDSKSLGKILNGVLYDMADTILIDSERLGTYWCNGCLKVDGCDFKHPRDCVVDSFWKDGVRKFDRSECHGKRE